MTKVTIAELVVLAGISRGIVSWSDICRNYFGIARFKGLGGRNAVHQKLTALKGKELVEKDGSKYSLTAFGQEAIDARSDVFELVSPAREAFEAANVEATETLAEEQVAFDDKFPIPTALENADVVDAVTEVAEATTEESEVEVTEEA